MILKRFVKLFNLPCYSNLGTKGAQPNTRARRYCKSPGCKIKAAWYCVACSPNDPQGDEKEIFVLCGLNTGRTCYSDHFVDSVRSRKI